MKNLCLYLLSVCSLAACGSYQDTQAPKIDSFELVINTNDTANQVIFYASLRDDADLQGYSLNIQPKTDIGNALQVPAVFSFDSTFKVGGTAVNIKRSLLLLFDSADATTYEYQLNFWDKVGNKGEEKTGSFSLTNPKPILQITSLKTSTFTLKKGEKILISGTGKQGTASLSQLNIGLYELLTDSLTQQSAYNTVPDFNILQTINSESIDFEQFYTTEKIGEYQLRCILSDENNVKSAIYFKVFVQ